MSVLLLATALAIAPEASGSGAQSPEARAISRTQIVYVSKRKMFAVSPGGDRRRLVARVPRGVVDISASLDGRRFALLVNRPPRVGETGGDRRFYLLEPEKGVKRLLLQMHEVGPLSVALSPRGSQLAFVRDGEIWVMAIGDGRVHRLTAGPGVAADPAFVPGRGEVVFTRRQAGETGVFRAALAGGPEREIVAGLFAEPAVSAAGVIAFRTRTRHSETEQLGVFAEGDVAPRFVAQFHNPFRDGGPAFSPDGRRVAFINLTEGSRRNRYSIRSVGLAGDHGMTIVGSVDAGTVGPLWTAVPVEAGG